MKLALTCHRTSIEVWGKTTRLGEDEIYPLVDGAEIAVKELRTFLRDCCCPRTRTRNVCNYCIAYGKFKMKRTFKLHIKGNNKGMFTCNDDEHPSIYINGGSSNDKLLLKNEFAIGVGTIIYMREPCGNWDDVKMEFHVVAINEDDEEIDVETSTSSTNIESVGIIDNDDTIDIVAGKIVGLDTTEATAVAANADVFDNGISTPKSLMYNKLIGTPISSTPVQIGSVAFALPVEQHHYSPGLFSIEAMSNQSAPDPPDSTTKKLIISKDPTGKSPKFRMQSPQPVRSPPPVNQDKESWLQEDRMMNLSTNQMMDYSTTEKCKKE